MKISPHVPPAWSMVTLIIGAILVLAGVGLLLAPGSGRASVTSSSGTHAIAESSSGGGASLESVASKAVNTGRRVAMSMIALAFALAGIVLAFRRDFKEAVGVFAIGLIAVLLVTPAGVNLLHETVNSLLGSQ